MANEIRIVLADDHPIVRRGLRLNSESMESIETASGSFVITKSSENAKPAKNGGLISESSPPA
jgi:hypothetical protein